MADPKIRYDIQADVAGNAEVGKLATQIEQLAGTLDGELKTAALASADALRKLAQKDGAVQNFVDLKRESQQAAAGLKDAQAAAQKLGSELASIATPTRAQAGQLEKLRDAVRNAKAEVISKSAAVVQARGTLQQYGVSTDNLAQSQRNIKTAIAAARTEVAALAPAWQSAAAGATASAGQQLQASKKIETGLDSLKTQLSTLRNIATAALGGSYLGSLASDVAATADAYNNLQARIKLVTGEGAAFESAFEGVTAVALRTSSSLENTGNLFSKLSDAGKAMGVGQAEALKLTETVNQAVQLSGASAQASDAAITQLIQGLQSGVLRGDEFNSVMEQSPRLARALADGLGTTTGELRKMAEAGQLSSDVVIKALQGQADVVATEFSKLPPTVGRAIENLTSSWTLYVGEIDKATGASSAAAGAINALSNNLEEVAGFLITAGKGVAALYAFNLAQKFAEWAIGASKAAADTGTATAATAAHSVAVRVNTTEMDLNTAAKARNAGVGVAASVTTQTQAAGANTTAVRDNSKAWGELAGSLGVASKATAIAGAAAGETAVKKGILSKAIGGVAAAGRGLTSILGGPLGLGVLTATYAKDIGELVAKLVLKAKGMKTAEDAAAAMAKADAAAKAGVDALRAAQEQQAQASKDAALAQFELGKAGSAAIAEFDKLTKSGDSAAEAVGKIAKDFDLSKVPGIQGAAAVLDKLAFDGKLTASEFEKAWADALKGADLAVFEIRARAAFAGTAREVERLAQVMDVTLREAMNRTGLDFNVISGGMSKASQSAINDTESIIKGLERLKVQGIDTAAALTASIGKGIDTADTQKALDSVRLQVESVRKVLGDKVADGLLDQAKTKATELGEALEKAKPGINSLREAMKELGVTSDQTFKDTATKSKAAYDEMKNSGKASARELSEGFKKYATDAIAANGGVATETLKAEASMRGLKIETDSTGKAIVKAMGEGNDAMGRLKGGVDSNVAAFRALAGAAYEATSAIGKANMAKANAAVDDGQFLVAGKYTEDAKREDAIDASGKARAKTAAKTEQGGNYLTQLGAYDSAKAAGATEADALRIAQDFGIDPKAPISGSMVKKWDPKGFQSAVNDAVLSSKQQAIQPIDPRNRTDQTGIPGYKPTDATQNSVKVYTVNINTGSGQETINTASDADAQRLIRFLQSAKLSA